MKFKYIGEESQNLAGVGIVKPGDIIEVTDAQGKGLQEHAPEQFKLVKDKPAPVDPKNPKGDIPADDGTSGGK